MARIEKAAEELGKMAREDRRLERAINNDAMTITSPSARMDALRRNEDKLENLHREAHELAREVMLTED